MFRLTEVDCVAANRVNFIYHIVFIFCSYSILKFTKELTGNAFSVESEPYFARSEYARSL